MKAADHPQIWTAAFRRIYRRGDQSNGLGAGRTVCRSVWGWIGRKGMMRKRLPQEEEDLCGGLFVDFG